ncbi:MAG: CAP domain-containing protein [Candidatus Pacebacteria bacterium]|nr:CAP domain-containing protein [Candidatus Paceibacterota bacterium]
MKKFRIIVLILIIVSLLIFFFWENISGLYARLSLKLPQVERNITNLVQEASKQVLTPSPLRVENEAENSFLTQKGVIQWTNDQRAKYGLPLLTENARLDVSAEAKVGDMFENQYFEHNSPSGLGVEDLAKSAGYDFIVIGENLAMGNFENDKTLVRAWMDSPGHRENILNPKFQEIGVAVERGIFEGKTVWMAVQHFGMPLSACPQVDENLKVEIEANQIRISELERTLAVLEADIKSAKPKHGDAYSQKIEQYNLLVNEYNSLVAEIKILVNKYNNQINLFNQCAGSI